MKTFHDFVNKRKKKLKRDRKMFRVESDDYVIGNIGNQVLINKKKVQKKK